MSVMTNRRITQFFLDSDAHAELQLYLEEYGLEVRPSRTAPTCHARTSATPSARIAQQ